MDSRQEYSCNTKYHRNVKKKKKKKKNVHNDAHFYGNWASMLEENTLTTLFKGKYKMI
jgi:hypothetical protein